MVSMECEPIMGIRGRDPSRLQGQSPWSGGLCSSLKLKVFGLSEVQMKCKIVYFCYPVNCLNVLFERILCLQCFDVIGLMAGRTSVL